MNARFNPRQGALFWLDHEVGDDRITDVDHLVPVNALTGEVAPGLQRYLSRTGATGNAHRSAGQRVTKMSRMKVPFVTHSRRKNTAKDADIDILTQNFTDRPTLPPRGHRVGQRVSQSGYGYYQREKA